MIKLGSHVGMSGKDMMLGSVKEAVSYNANTFMLYTGAPQNTRRKPLEELNIEEAKKCMADHKIEEFIVHAPYIINLGNTIKPETYEIGVQFLELEIRRTIAMGSHVLVLHPGAHVGAGVKEGVASIVKGINGVLREDTDCYIALETMAGKGTEIGRSFEELAMIFDGVVHNDKLRVCFDTCHTHDSGYDIIHDFDGVMDKFDYLIGKEKIAAFHINDSMNECGAKKDRHANLGEGKIGFEALRNIVWHPEFTKIPKILETPWIKLQDGSGISIPPYKEEIERLLAAEPSDR